jgi:hypothetical protein
MEQAVYIPPMIVEFGSVEACTQEDPLKDHLPRGKGWSFEADNVTPQY